MQYNYFPGRLRVRDSVFRVEEIRAAAIRAVRLLADDVQIQYNEKTSSILAVYDASKLNVDDLRPLLPYLLKIEPKVRFYTPAKKQDILDGIQEIERRIAQGLSGKQQPRQQ
ncbi:MAG TPA: hypothetical protein DDW78_07175 [Treponema sp.]|nr:hypothetical protein [Treponema sp.]